MSASVEALDYIRQAKEDLQQAEINLDNDRPALAYAHAENAAICLAHLQGIKERVLVERYANGI